MYSSEFKASLVYTVNSKTARATQGDPDSENQINTRKATVELMVLGLYPFLGICGEGTKR